MSEAKKPIHRIQRSSIQAAIWANQRRQGQGVFYTVSFQRRYRTGKEGEWRTVYSYSKGDLLWLLKVADLAFAAIEGFEAAAEADKKFKAAAPAALPMKAAAGASVAGRSSR